VDPQRPFNREKFLLVCVAYIIFIQFFVWGVVGLACAGVFLYKSTKEAGRPNPTCERTAQGFQEASQSSLAVLLALLGGSSVIAAVDQKRKEDAASEQRKRSEEQAEEKPDNHRVP
jgi:hypothetical protein